MIWTPYRFQFPLSDRHRGMNRKGGDRGWAENGGPDPSREWPDTDTPDEEGKVEEGPGVRGSDSNRPDRPSGSTPRRTDRAG